MTEPNDKLVEERDIRAELGTLVHGELSRANVMAYLDMPIDTADRVAVAVLPIHTRDTLAAYHRGLRDAAAICDEVAESRRSLGLVEGFAITIAKRIRERMSC